MLPPTAASAPPVRSPLAVLAAAGRRGSGARADRRSRGAARRAACTSPTPRVPATPTRPAVQENPAQLGLLPAGGLDDRRRSLERVGAAAGPRRRASSRRRRSFGHGGLGFGLSHVAGSPALRRSRGAHDAALAYALGLGSAAALGASWVARLGLAGYAGTDTLRSSAARRARGAGSRSASSSRTSARRARRRRSATAAPVGRGARGAAARHGPSRARRRR